MARFIADQRTDHRVPHAVACRALEVNESWFYKWRDREPTARQRRRVELDAAVKASFDDSGGNPGTYGWPRVWEDLVAAGWSAMGTGPATSLPVRLDPELRRALDQRAAAEHRTVSEVIRDALRHHL